MGNIPRCERALAALKSRHYLRFPPGVGGVTTHTKATDYLHAALQAASLVYGINAATGRRLADLHAITAAA
jgi:hypothetical protein